MNTLEILQALDIISTKFVEQSKRIEQLEEQVYRLVSIQAVQPPTPHHPALKPYTGTGSVVRKHQEAKRKAVDS